jgi:hypothetical protein
VKGSEQHKQYTNYTISYAVCKNKVLSFFLRDRKVLHSRKFSGKAFQITGAE